MTDVEVYTGAALMGVASGMRSLASPAIVSQLAKSGLAPVNHSALGFLNSPVTAKTAAIMAIGEVITDKLPFIPKRTQTPSLVFRAISGAASGAAVTSARKRSVLWGALIGAAAAIGATYGAYHARRWAAEKFDVPDPIIAVLEDALVVGCGVLALSAARKASAAAD